jgi:hypothetical protein
MGLNVENLFVQTDSAEAALAAVKEHLEAASRLQVPHDWPLEVTAGATNGRKIAVSDARNGWIALVDAAGSVDPALAVFLSAKLRARVVVAQIFEVTGDAGVAVLDSGVVSGGPTRDDRQDPLTMVRTELQRHGVPFDLLTFRETAGPKAAGWRHVSVREGH